MTHLVFNEKYAGKDTTKLIGTGGSVYRVKAANDAGGFDERIQGATEDNDIAYRILKLGWRLYIIKVGFLIKYNEKLKKVWRKNYWYGYGSHFTFHRHPELRKILHRSTPFAGFFEGILASSKAYELTGKKLAFLLPFFISIKRTAWCLGFIKSHFASYGHVLQPN